MPEIRTNSELLVVLRRRRDALLAALARHLPWLEPVGVSAGLHLVTWLPPHLDEDAVVGAARRAGGPGCGRAVPHHDPGPGGLIFGYATVSERAIAEGVARLAHALRELRRDLGLRRQKCQWYRTQYRKERRRT
jgi:GntR family transcriptional regulator/MocR family aminotransferase